MADFEVRKYVKPEHVTPGDYQRTGGPEVEALNVYARRLKHMLPALPVECLDGITSAAAAVGFLREHGDANAEMLVALYLGEKPGVIQAVYNLPSRERLLQTWGETALAVVRGATGEPDLDLSGRCVFRPGFRHRRDCMLPNMSAGGDGH